MEIEVSGKKVVLRDHLGARAGWNLMQKAVSKGQQGQGMRPLEDVIEELTLMVESWDFDGDPTDPKVYEALDFFEVWDLSAALQAYFQNRFNKSKNSQKAST